MTFTSFNPIHHPQVENNKGNHVLTIKQGQVFHGTIKKLYPDNTAEVQIGNHKMIAKLEVPLKVGDSYFLQVKNVNPQIELSLMTNSTTSLTPKQQLVQLIETMNLPKSIEVQQLLNFFIKNEVPVIKEQLQEAIQWIKNLPQGVTKQEAFLALQKMINDKMPFQQTIFHALIFGSKTNGILENIETFKAAIAREQHLPNDIKMGISNTLQKLSTPIEGEIGGEILRKAIQTLLTNNGNNDLKVAMFNLLKETNILPKSATLQNWQTLSFTQITQQGNPLSQHAGEIVQKIYSSNETTVHQTIEHIKGWLENGLLSKERKIELFNLLTNFQKGIKDGKSIEQFARLFHQKLIEAFSNNTTNQLFSIDKNGMTTKEHLASLLNEPNRQEQLHSQFVNLLKQSNEVKHPVIQSTIRETEQLVQSTLDSKAIHFALKTVLKNLGISYEAALQTSEAEEVRNLLKPQLLYVMQHNEVSQQVKETSELLLSRLNGMQLVSSEQNHQHQLVMQVPLQFLGKKIDATVQWNGRMKKDGKIDANYARILFYLNMETLQETVIDMQVQNRIVTIQFYNENKNLEQVAEPLKQILKTRLLEHDYHLSGIFFKQFQTAEHEVQKKKDVVEHSGVDIRI